MTDLQNKYDILLEDIKLLLQYDDKYMKIDKTKIVKPNILNELEEKISDFKQKQSNIKLQIKNNNDRKALLINDISSITIQNTNIEKEISELNNNTKIIQEEQQSKLDLINSKCKELEELSDTTHNQVYKDIIKQIMKVVNNNCILLEPINNLYYSKSENLIFTKFTIFTKCTLEQFDIPKLEFYKKLYQLKDVINKDIIDLNILNNNGINTNQSYIDFIVDKNFPTKQEFIEMIKYEKFKKNLEDMIEVINKEIYKYNWLSLFTVTFSKGEYQAPHIDFTY